MSGFDKFCWWTIGIAFLIGAVFSTELGSLMFVIGLGGLAVKYGAKILGFFLLPSDQGSRGADRDPVAEATLRVEEENRRREAETRQVQASIDQRMQEFQDAQRRRDEEMRAHLQQMREHHRANSTGMEWE